MEKPLTLYIDPASTPLTFKEYSKKGGYEGVRKALKEMTPAEVTEKVKKANLKGRGGAGFSAGMKWSFINMNESAKPKYLLCNADEMEPGSFKDRYLLEGNPHQLIAGMIIAAYAIQAETAYIYMRWAYKKAEKHINKALEEAYEAGLLGKNILGSGFSLDIHLHMSAGRYICGDDVAMINAMEGRRAIPHAKPPSSVVSGLFGRPTVTNNVETLSWIDHIIHRGAKWFRALSLTDEGGTKLYGVSGRVKNPGLWELPMGTTMREILSEHAGGMAKGRKFRGLLPGGASSDFLIDDHMDMPMDFETVAKAGSRLGTGTLIVLDDGTCPVAFIRNLENFFALESCGWCTPCREGLPWTEKLLGAIDEGKGKMEDIERLKNHARFLGPGHTFCALAPGAAEPLQSGLKYYYDDFVKHIEEKKCPWK